MTYYEILQVLPTASDSVIKAAYRTLAQQYHPDKHPEDGADMSSTMQMINEAYRTLSDPALRQQYDESLQVEAAAGSNATPNHEPKPARPGFFPLFVPSPELAAIVGTGPLYRTEVTNSVWRYIKDHRLQDAKNARMINADIKLKVVFAGREQVSMFEMTKLVFHHLHPLSPQ